MQRSSFVTIGIKPYRFALVLIVLPPLALSLRAQTDAAYTPRVTDAPLAEVNGHVVREVELDAAIKPQIVTMREQERRLREAVLAKLIDNLLIADGAKAEGLSVAAFVKKHVESTAVTDQEVEREFDRSRHKFVGALDPEAKYRVRRGLEDNRRAEAFRALTERLRKSAAIKNYLTQPNAAALQDLTKTGLVRGNASAPILVVEFLDYQCPFCRGANDKLKTLLETHPNKVKLLVKHFPIDSHRLARGAAKAAVCAEKEPARYWALHDSLYQSGADLSLQGLVKLAVSQGYDQSAFAECMKADEPDARVEAEFQAAKLLGVDRTPYFILGDRRLFSVEEVIKAVTE